MNPPKKDDRRAELEQELRWIAEQLPIEDLRALIEMLELCAFAAAEIDWGPGERSNSSIFSMKIAEQLERMPLDPELKARAVYFAETMFVRRHEA